MLRFDREEIALFQAVPAILIEYCSVLYVPVTSVSREFFCRGVLLLRKRKQFHVKKLYFAHLYKKNGEKDPLVQYSAQK